MKRSFVVSLVIITLLCFNTIRSQTSNDKSVLQQEFNLGIKHSAEPQYWKMESKMITYAMNGERTGEDIFRLYIKCSPAKDGDTKGDEYTCTKFTAQLGNNPEVEIPSLKDWSYFFNGTHKEKDGKEIVLGIDHAKFENLTDANGKPIPIDKTYHVYNAFIDFHSVCNVLGDKTTGGKGIQDLKKIGDEIVHVAAYSEPPVDLGDKIEHGSTFKNGKITLLLKGLSFVENHECALVGYDSGESSFKMLMKPMSNMEITTVGSSHYKGDIYKDLVSGWVQKADLNELVVSETTLPMAPNKVSNVIEREITITNLNKD